jgi:serine/threonine-protein kinase
MGEVFLAEDDRLGRRVALKSPFDQWLETADARARLHREARAAARLSHPNIASVYDVLDEGGRPYIVMEHVDGESLSAIVSHGPVPPARAVDIAIQLADALAAAHAAGVIHRDLKPGNVMVCPDGRVKVLDFGVASFVEPESGTAPLTTPGQILGTPGYVAPEQWLGRPADARSDIYAAGAILYEMLTGRAPVSTDGGGMAALLSPVPPITAVMPSVAPDLAAIVTRAMAREPAERVQSAEELKHALEAARAALGEQRTQVMAAGHRVPRTTIALALLLLVVAAGIPFARWWRSAARETTRASSTPPVVAVLPLDNLSSDPGLQYVGAGLADTMSTKLATVSGVAVVSRAEITDALQRTHEVSTIGRSLGASYVVTGGVQQSGGRVQVTINLLSADGRRIINGGIYEDSLTNIFALQRRIAEDLSQRMLGTVSDADRAQLARNPTTSVDALAAYWRGRVLMEQPGPDPIDPAIEAFEDATGKDASFALGYAGLASAYWRKYDQTREQAWAARALSTAQRAREIDPDEPEVRYALATVYAGSGRPDAAIAELKQVLGRQPASETAHRKLGEIFASQGQVDEAVSEFRTAISIRPDYWATHRALGVTLWRAGRLADAADAFQRVIDLQPDSPFGYQLMGNVRLTQGDVAAATRAFEAAMAHGGSFATSSSLGYVYYIQGRYADAAAAYQRAIDSRPNSGTTHWNLADAYRHMGRDSDARREYTRAIALFDADLQVNPRDAVALAIRATCKARVGRSADARSDIGRAVALAPTDSDVQYQHALVLTMLGERDQAVAAVEKAVSNGYSRALLEVDQDLSDLRSSERFRAVLAGPGTPGRDR